MTSANVLLRGSTASILFTAAFTLGSAGADVIYSQTITNPLATVSTLDDFTNCRDAQGCLGHTGLVFDAAGNALAIGNLPDTIVYTFTLTPADIAAINADPNQTATLSMTASRDIGLRAGTAVNTDFLVSSLEGSLIGNLFGSTISTCPAGENFGPIDFTCGPNFHNDVTAVASLHISSPLFQSAVTDGIVSVVVNPTDEVGRLKIFSLTLRYETTSIPEAGTVALLGLALGGLAVSRRRRR